MTICLAVTQLCTVSHELKKGSLIRRAKAHFGKVRDISFTLGVEMGSANLDFFVIYNNGKNQEVGRFKQQYKELEE